MKRNIITITCALGLMTACGSSNETSPTARQMTGQVVSGTPALAIKLATAESCPVTEVMALNASGEVESSDIDENCSFSLDLENDQSYAVSFLADGVFAGTLIFQSGIDGFSDRVIKLDDSGTDIDLGQITLLDGVATPENNPLSFNDCDGDGVNDDEDFDDDDDGLKDYEEQDCDLDGFSDDDDLRDDLNDDSQNCQEQDLSTGFRRVKPYAGAEDVAIERDIRVSASCIVDQSSVSNDSFHVESADGTPLVGTFEFSDIGSENTIKFEHEENMAIDTSYTVTLDGILCENGDALPAISFSFATETEDTSDISNSEQEDDDESEDDDANEVESEDEQEDESGS